MENRNSIKDMDSLYIPQNDENINYPVNTTFVDLNRMYMGQMRWHWHEEIELIIINNGYATICIDDETITLAAGQAIMLNQGILHCVKPIPNEKCTFYSMLFHPSFLFSYGQAYLSSKYLAPVIDSTSLKYLLMDESVTWQAELIEHINNAIAANLTRKFGFELVTRAELTLFWTGLLKLCTKDDSPIETATIEVSADSRRVKQAIMYIEKHYASAITLEDIANSIHVSKSECCRCFKRTLKITPIEYVMKYRIFESTRKIRRDTPDSRSISSLAASVGFNNTSYFNKLFKKYLNCTPRQYKAMLEKDSSMRYLSGPFHPQDSFFSS